MAVAKMANQNSKVQRSAERLGGWEVGALPWYKGVLRGWEVQRLEHCHGSG